eukprot:gene9052-10688_t
MGKESKKATKAVTKSSHGIKETAAPSTGSSGNRVRTYVASPSDDFRSREERALQQKLFFVNQEDVTNEIIGISRKFAIMGTTGNIYNVKIQQQPACSCPYFTRGKKLCKHIIFVMVKVLQVDKSSPLIYQDALLQSELEDIFARASPLNAAKATHRDLDDTNQPEKKSESECPVCFESLEVALTLLDSCATCRNFIHKECLQNWIKVQHICCFCRSPWCSALPSSSTSSSSSSSRCAGGIHDEDDQDVGTIQSSCNHHIRFG